MQQQQQNKVKRVIENIHFFEGLAMCGTGPFLIAFPGLTLRLWDVEPSADGEAMLQCFGSLVTLMGWIEARYRGRLPKYCVEGWLIADVLFLGAFVRFIQRHGSWNIWSLLLSAGFPVAYAPLRVFWLWTWKANGSKGQ